jgi:membrane protein
MLQLPVARRRAAQLRAARHRIYRLLIVGPIVVVSFLALSHNALETATAGIGRYMPFFERLVAIGEKVSPYFMVATIFTAVYMLVPNTKVKWKPAIIGGVAAGILWAAVGQLFTALVVYSTRLTVVYALFASLIAALLWTYFGWLILLVGAQLSFYVQNPNYLRMGLTELRMSAVQREQLTLKIMFLIGRAYHDGKTRWTVDSLGRHLGMPGIAISRLVHALEDAHLVTLTDDEHCCRLVISARFQFRKSSTSRAMKSPARSGGAISPFPAVDAISKTMDVAWRKSCGDMSLRDLIEEA